jgi:C-terminal processing protease CtpA/Prc
MGSRLWIIVFIFLSNSLFSQPLNESKRNRLATFGKVWGFLKYYHPKVASGKTNWDETLVNNYYSVRNIDNKIDFNRKITRLLDSVGIVLPARSKALDFPDSLKRNLNIDWIDDTTYLSPYNSKRLRYIFENRQPGKNFYISRRSRVGNPDFKNEKLYSDLLLPSEPYRILGLVRFWNIINYYFPYLYLLDRQWDDVLSTYIPRFVNITSDYEYFRKIQELVTQINDAHGMVFSGKYNYFSSMHMVPLKFASINNETFVVELLNDSLCQNAGIQKGDKLLKMDIFEVDVIRSHHARFMPSSNKTYLNYKIDQWLSLVKTDSVSLELEREDKIIKTRIASVNNSRKIKLHPDKKYAFTNWKLISDSIGYINMGMFSKLDINPAYNKLKHTKYLIIDSRNYPNWVVYPLANKLLRTRKIFMHITEPDYDYPGHVKYIPPMKAGTLYNTDYYKGKIILLVNSETMSRAEFTAMAIMQAENVTVIGTQTAGADGDVSVIPFPGGIYCYYSGLGVFHPDGKDTQRIGLVPDIEVKLTLQGLINGEDEYINRAMEYIQNGK